MGIIYMILSKLGAAGKMIAMKKCGKVASGHENSVKINLIRSLGCFIISLAVALIGGMGNMKGTGAVISAVSGVANAALLFSWVLAATLAPMSTVEIFCMIGGIVIPLILSPLMIEAEAVSVIEWLGALILFPAAICFRAPRSTDGGGMKASAVPYLLLAGLSNSACVLTQKLYAAYDGGGTAEFNLFTFGVCSATLALCFGAMKLFGALKRRRGALCKEKEQCTQAQFSEGRHNGTHSEAGGLGGKSASTSTKTALYVAVAVVMLYLSNYFSLLASYALPSGLLFPLSYAIGMPLTVACDTVFFGEKIRLRTVIGAVLVIISVILTGLG